MCKFTFVSSYLALVAALATEADYVFIPEDPAVVNWQEKICHKLLQVLILKHEARTQFYRKRNLTRFFTFLMDGFLFRF